MKENKLRPVRGMLLVFILLTAFFLLQQKRLEQWGFDPQVLLAGNLLLLVVTLGSYLLLQRSLHASNPNAFVRAMYLGFIIKFFVLAVAAFIYILLTKKQVNKPSLVACAALYIVYTFMEVSVLTRLLKQKKDA